MNFIKRVIYAGTGGGMMGGATCQVIYQGIVGNWLLMSAAVLVAIAGLLIWAQSVD